MLVFSLLAMTIVPILALGQAITPGGPCPPGGGSFCPEPFSNIILRCSTANGTNGILQAGNCDDNLAGVPPVGVKTDAICGNSTANNADCYLPPYPPFITVPASTSTTSTSTTSTSTSIPASAPAAGNSTMTSPTPTKSTSITKSTSTSTSTGAVPFVSSAGQIYIPGIGTICGIVGMIVGGLLL